jgi:hypothetical protein
MIFELTLMLISAALIAALFFHKYMEVSRGLRTRMHDVQEKTDPILRDLEHTTGRFFSYFTLHNFVLLCNWAFVHVVRLFMHTSRKVHDVSSTIVEKASKRTEDLSKAGAASFYIKQIKDAKGSGEMAQSGAGEEKM